MRNTFAIKLLAIALAVTCTIQAQETQPASQDEEPSRYRHIAVLRITCDPALLPAGTYLPIKYLLDAGMVGKAFRETVKAASSANVTITGVAGVQDFVAPEDPLQDNAARRVEPHTGSGVPGVDFTGHNVIMVSIDVMADQTVSAQLWSVMAEKIRSNLERALREMHEHEARRVEELLHRAAAEAAEQEHRIKEVRAGRANILSATDALDLSRESVAELARELEKERQETEIKIDYLNARQEAIRKMIAELAAQAKDPARLENPLIEAYKLKLDAVQRKLEDTKQRVDRGLAAQSELRDAEVQLQMAKAELAAKMQEVVDAAGGKRLPALNDELFTISLEMIEAQARQAALEKRAARIKELLKLSDRYTELGQPLPAFEAAYQQARQTLAQLQRRRENLQPPTVRLLNP